MMPCGGIGAALIMHAEMSGLPAFKLTAITGEHYMSAEMIHGAFSGVMQHLGLHDLSDLQKMKSFRTCLKEANQRSNNIYS